jgi:hypothetical protein
VLRAIYPALPRCGTDFMTLPVVMRIVNPYNHWAVIESENRRTASGKAEAGVKTLSESKKLSVCYIHDTDDLGNTYRCFMT